jgi:hypothetical protein
MIEAASVTDQITNPDFKNIKSKREIYQSNIMIYNSSYIQIHKFTNDIILNFTINYR